MNRIAVLAVVTACLASSVIAAQPEPLTDPQTQAIREAAGLPPGSTVRLVRETKGSSSIDEHGEASGNVGLSLGRLSATATQFNAPDSPWANPLFWIGVVCLGGAGVGFYAGLRRAALVSAVAGSGLIACAFYPGLMLILFAVAFGVVFGPYLWAEWKKRKAESDAKDKTEALRAVVEGVESVTPNVQDAVKDAIARAADLKDKQVIKAIKVADGY